MSPIPNIYRPLLAGADQGKAVLEYIENVLFQSNVPPAEVAAILVEPIQGEGGYLVPPDGFLAGLRALCDRHGILLIFDEVQSGIGRTGRMFASQHWGVTPDIMTLAKGLASGLPIGLVVARRKHMEKWQRGAHGNTFGGNPLCCAAALATLALVESEYAANAAEVGEYFLGRLRELQKSYPASEMSGEGPDDRHGAGRRSRVAGPGKGVMRDGAHAGIPTWTAAAVLRPQHGTLHSTAHDQPCACR